MSWSNRRRRNWRWSNPSTTICKFYNKRPFGCLAPNCRFQHMTNNRGESLNNQRRIMAEQDKTNDLLGSLLIEVKKLSTTLIGRRRRGRRPQFGPQNRPQTRVNMGGFVPHQAFQPPHSPRRREDSPESELSFALRQTAAHTGLARDRPAQSRLSVSQDNSGKDSSSLRSLPHLSDDQVVIAEEVEAGLQEYEVNDPSFGYVPDPVIAVQADEPALNPRQAMKVKGLLVKTKTLKKGKKDKGDDDEKDTSDDEPALLPGVDTNDLRIEESEDDDDDDDDDEDDDQEVNDNDNDDDNNPSVAKDDGLSKSIDV